MLKKISLKKYLPKIILDRFAGANKTPAGLPDTDVVAIFNTTINLVDVNKSPVSVEPGIYKLTRQVVNEIVYFCVDADPNFTAPKAYWEAQLQKGRVTVKK